MKKRFAPLRRRRRGQQDDVIDLSYLQTYLGDALRAVDRQHAPITGDVVVAVEMIDGVY